jgi:hypothetical protein
MVGVGEHGRGTRMFEQAGEIMLAGRRSSTSPLSFVMNAFSPVAREHHRLMQMPASWRTRFGSFGRHMKVA